MRNLQVRDHLDFRDFVFIVQALMINLKFWRLILISQKPGENSGSLISEFNCTGSMPPKIVSFNLTSSQEFSLNEVQIYADFSTNATHWTEWSDWSKCGPECAMVNGQPKG